MDIFSYLLGKKASGGGGGGSSIDWSQIGYDEAPDYLKERVDYSKNIYDNWDSTITDRSNAYASNQNLLFFPNVDTSNIQNAYQMFTSCTKLISIGDNFDCSNMTNCEKMFYSCSTLEEVGDIITTKATGTTAISSIFMNCSNLKKVGKIVINSQYSQGMFTNCTNLITIGEIETSLKDYTYKFVQGCNSLSNDSLKEILKFAKKLTNQMNQNKNLKIFGLSQTQAETCTTFDEWTDLANNGWTTGY